MALRGHHFAERCSACDEPAAGHCPRCGEIFCAEHLPPSDRRCARCEVVYAERLERERPDPWLADLLLATGIGGTVAAALVVGPPAALVAAAITLVTWGTMRYRELDTEETEPDRLRSEFLAERTRLLPERDEV